MEEKVIKPSLNQIRLYLAKWLPSVRKKDASGRSIITSDELQEICNLISPSLDHCMTVMQKYIDDRNIFDVRIQLMAALLYNTWDDEHPHRPEYWPELNTRDILKAEAEIEGLGLSENIKLNISPRLRKRLLKKPPQGKNEPAAQKLEIKNLNISGDVFGIDLYHIDEIEFTNNVFQGTCIMQVTGTPKCHKCTFRNNQFLQSFFHSTFNVAFIDFTDNKCLGQIELDFSPPSMGLRTDANVDYKNKEDLVRKFDSGIKKFQLVGSRLKFTKNKTFTLSLRDRKASVAPYKSGVIPFRKIEFLGGNVIDCLRLETHHSDLNGSSDVRADANRISFDASDEINPSVSSNKPYNIYGIDSQVRELQLLYLEFFSLLKEQTAKHHNPVLEDVYAKKVRYFSRVLVSRWQDKFILIWTDWISRDGTSWLRPLFLLVTTETLLATIAYYFLGWDLNYSSEEGWRAFITLFSWFMNPASLLPLPTPSDPVSNTITTISGAWLIYLLFLFQKLFAAIFYYEIIKVLRRFTK